MLKEITKKALRILSFAFREFDSLSSYLLLRYF